MYTMCVVVHDVAHITYMLSALINTCSACNVFLLTDAPPAGRRRRAPGDGPTTNDPKCQLPNATAAAEWAVAVALLRVVC
jgi:hypothetical protein